MKKSASAAIVNSGVGRDFWRTNEKKKLPKFKINLLQKFYDNLINFDLKKIHLHCKYCFFLLFSILMC